MIKKENEEKKEGEEKTKTENGKPNNKKIDFKKLRLNTNFPTHVGTASVLSTIPIRSPRPDEFFRVRYGDGDEWVYDTYLLSFKDNRDERYLVLEEFLPLLQERNLVKPVRFFLLIAWGTNVMFLSEIPLPQQGLEDKYSPYHKSRMEHYKLAESRWVSITADSGLRAYRVTEALGKLPEPSWAAKPANIEEAIEIAFKDRVIDDINHPVLRRLRGEE